MPDIMGAKSTKCCRHTLLRRHVTRFGLVLCLMLAPHTAEAIEEYGWKGKSNAHGGLVQFGYLRDPLSPEFNPELSEGEWVTIRCDGFDGRASIEIGTDYQAPTNENSRSLETHRMIFDVGGDTFERSGPLAEGGLYPGSPIALLERGDPLLETIMRGYSMDVYVGAESDRAPDLTVALSGTREIFTRHLSNCL